VKPNKRIGINRLASTILIIMLIFILSDCNKVNIDACDVTNPLKNLSWLEEKVDELKEANRIEPDVTANIYLVRLKDQDLFGINHCITCSHTSIQYYDCSGEYICGAATINSYDECEFTEEDFIEKTLIWTNN
jgi:hypothetical protein